MTTSRHAVPRVAAALLVSTLGACGSDDGPDEADTGADAAADTGGDAQHDASPGDDAMPSGDATPGDEGSEILFPDVDWCDGTTVFRYDPLVAEELLAFPDDIYSVVDASTPTGRRLDGSETHTPWTKELPALLRSIALDMGTLSGFASNGGLVIRFTAPVAEALPAGEAESMASAGLVLADLSTEPPTRIPYEARSSDGGLDVILWPLQPLRRGGRHALVVTTALQADDGGCIAPSEATRAMLAGGAPARLAEAGVWARDALDALELELADISGIVTFTVHDDVAPVVAAAAAVTDAGSDGWTSAACEDGESRRTCEVSFTASDFRGDRYVSSDRIAATWELTATLWLPVGDGPFPVVVYGHGINDSRASGRGVADLLNPLGIAVIANDALWHGQHPTASGDGSLAALDFLGIKFTPLGVDPLTLRGNFDQTVLDRLQLIEAIRETPDVDGDGIADLDIDRVGYFGISLGGMLGAGFAALSQDVSAVVLSVPGGRLLEFVSGSSIIASFLPALRNIIGSEELFTRLVPVAQALVDPSDPATMGALILADRPFGDTPPSLLMPVSVFDETVPPPTGRALARAVGLPQTGPVFYDVEVIGTVDAPVSGNVAGGEATAAYFQLDRVTSGDGVERSNHNNTPLGREGAEQARHFMQTWLDGRPEIIDPYATLGTPPLSE